MRVWLLSLSLLVLLGGCAQYKYASPAPGTIEVRLRTKSQNIPYSALNAFYMQLTEVRAVRSDSAKLEIYEDLKAINRSYPLNFNAFDSTAYDSSMVLGEAYAPPGNYVGLDLILQPLGLIVLDGYRDIQVKTPLDFQSYAGLRAPFKIYQSKTTIVTVTFNVDSSLTRGAESFHFTPVYYVSSIVEH